MTRIEKVFAVAKQLEHYRGVDMSLVVNEDAFLDELVLLMNEPGVDAHFAVEGPNVFADDVREALGHPRVCS